MITKSHRRWEQKAMQIAQFMHLPGTDMAREFIEKIKLHDAYRNEKFEDAHAEVWKLLCISIA